MKKLIFIFSFVFAMFFSNATFAASTDNSLVNEKEEIVLTETNEIFDVIDTAVVTKGDF